MYLTENGYKTASTKWVTVYPYNSSSDVDSNNYNVYKSLKSTTYGFGDAILETSIAGDGSTAWNVDYSYFANGYPSNDLGFRAILIGKI